MWVVDVVRRMVVGYILFRGRSTGEGCDRSNWRESEVRGAEFGVDDWRRFGGKVKKTCEEVISRMDEIEMSKLMIGVPVGEMWTVSVSCMLG